MTPTPRKKRLPKLSYSENRGIGYFVSYRDPASGQPKKHTFGKVSRREAVAAYEEWLAKHLKGETPPTARQPKIAIPTGPRKLVEQIDQSKSKHAAAEIVPGCLLQICSNFLTYEESRIRPDDSERRQNTITRKQCKTRNQFTQDFLAYINTKHGGGAVSRMKLADLAMDDVESYNKLLVDSDFSDSQVKKRLQCIKAIIDRAGRPENGKQLLAWNWGSRDHYHGRPDKAIAIPTLKQLKLILRQCDEERAAIVWLAIGCGFGQRDLSAIHVGDIDAKSYDLRRPKTGIDRYGETPKLVWNVVGKYLKKKPRPDGELMFLTQRGKPLVHGDSDSVEQWWARLRKSLGEAAKGLNGFYSLRHLGATEFGSRPGSSIGEVRRWLGHSASSAVADRYMKPVSPQTRPVVEWVRASLRSANADVRLTS